MRKVYLIHYTKGRGTTKDDRVEMQEDERDVIQYAAGILTGAVPDTKIDEIYEVDLMQGTMKEKTLLLEDMKLKLVDKATLVPYLAPQPPFEA